METPELPDDVQRWPQNPWHLLGLSPGVSARDLKRRYTELIRRFKPEHSPEQFRRIREAYETAQAYLAWSSVDQAAANPAPESIQFPETQIAADRRPSVKDLWDLACGGQEQQAYARLQEAEARYPGDAEFCVRLYWLLIVLPELDPQKIPCDWLISGIRGSGLVGPCRELYRRAIESRQEQPLRPAAQSLLGASLPSRHLLELLSWRWKAVERQPNAMDVIEGDLAIVRERLYREGEDCWAETVLMTLETLAWQSGDRRASLKASLLEELAALSHRHLEFEGGLDRLEFVEDLTQEIHELQQTTPASFLDVVARSWAQPVREWQNQLLEVLRDWHDRPTEFLFTLDRVYTHAPAVLVQFGRAIEEAALRPEIPYRTDECVESQVVDFAKYGTAAEYSAIRLVLLNFLTKEWIAPSQFVSALECHPDIPRIDIAQRLRVDWPLIYACEALRLIRA